MKIQVDRTICAGHAICAMKAPTLFELDEEGFCISDGRQVPPGMEVEAENAADYCPERAITLVED